MRSVLIGVDRLYHKLSCIVFLIAAVVCLSMTGCEKSKGSSASSDISREEEPNTSDDKTEETAAPSEETLADVQDTSVTTETFTKTEPVSGEAADTTQQQSADEPSTETPQDQLEKAKQGYSSAYEAAQYYYNAYLTDNYELVYSMFCQEEIDAYNSYIDSIEMFDSPAASVFRKSAVTDAVKASMANIDALRADNQDSENDKWTVLLTEEDIFPAEDEDIAEFNDTLGTSFTSAADCGFVYYQDTDNQRAFVGNGCAFVEYEGKWYLSYASAMQSELLMYMEIF